jgi:hypothetical protein
VARAELAFLKPFVLHQNLSDFGEQCGLAFAFALIHNHRTMAQADRGRSLISSYGLFWKVDDTEWSQDGRKGKRRLLGHLGSKRSSIRIADFWSQSGIYVLYGNYGLYYVGIAAELGRRLRRHRSDKHANEWDRFSWFGFRTISQRRDSDGLLILGKSEAMSSIRLNKARHDIEAILFRAFAGPGNDKNPHFGNKLKQWEQVKGAEADQLLDRVRNR